MNAETVEGIQTDKVQLSDVSSEKTYDLKTFDLLKNSMDIADSENGDITSDITSEVTLNTTDNLKLGNNKCNETNIDDEFLDDSKESFNKYEMKEIDQIDLYNTENNDIDDIGNNNNLSFNLILAESTCLSNEGVGKSNRIVNNEIAALANNMHEDFKEVQTNEREKKNSSADVNDEKEDKSEKKDEKNTHDKETESDEKTKDKKEKLKVSDSVDGMDEVGVVGELMPVVTLTTKISEVDFDYDFIKPSESDSEDGDGESIRNEEDREMERNSGMFNSCNDSFLVDLKEDSTNIKIGNDKQEINELKTCKFFDDDEEEEDDDDIVVFDKPSSGMGGLVQTQGSEVVLEGIAEEPEDIKDEECDSVIINDEEDDYDISKVRGGNLGTVEKTYVIKEKVFEEDGEEVEDKENVCDSETLNENLEVKIKREEESLEHFQLQEKQIEEQVQQEQKKEQLQKQQEQQQQQQQQQQMQQEQQQQQQQQQEQQQTDFHEYVNVKQFSPKLQTTSFSDELPSKKIEGIETTTNIFNGTSEILSKDKFNGIDNVTRRVVENSMEKEANKAVLNEEDFNFEMEKDEYEVIDEANKRRREIKMSAKQMLENNVKEINEGVMKIDVAEDYQNNIGNIKSKEEMVSSINECNNEKKNVLVDNTDKLPTEIKREVNGFEINKTILEQHQTSSIPKNKIILQNPETPDFPSKHIEMTTTTTPTTLSTALNKIHTNYPLKLKTTTSSLLPMQTGSYSTPTTPATSRTRTTTCRTPTTPGTPNASSYVRYNDILPEAGCVKALVERWSRLDSMDEKGMNRSRSCGPISRKLKLMSPERELEEDSFDNRGMIGRIGGFDIDPHYNSQPSLTRSMLNKFEKLDQDVEKSMTKKKTYKWHVKEPKILKRPTYLPQ